MPTVLPSQITAFINAQFPDSVEFDHGAALQKIGALQALLELFDDMPKALIRLSPNETAQLLSSIAAIRFAVERFRNGSTADALRPVSRELNAARPIIARLPDHIPSLGHDLSFIGDAVLQQMIGLDVSAVETAIQSGEWKGATIIAGSCCEALLLFGLQHREAKAPGSVVAACKAHAWRRISPVCTNLLDPSWNLFSYAAVACQIGLISANTQAELEPSREYRNLIHPAKSVREQVHFDRGTAFVGAGALDHVIADLRKNL